MVPADALAVDLGSAFDESGYLVFASALLFGLLAFHVAWVARQRTGGERRKAQPESADEEGMVVCPECSQTTEADYRYCQHCVADVGGSFVDLGDGGGGERSGMF